MGRIGLTELLVFLALLFFVRIIYRMFRGQGNKTFKVIVILMATIGVSWAIKGMFFSPENHSPRTANHQQEDPLVGNWLAFGVCDTHIEGRPIRSSLYEGTGRITVNADGSFACAGCFGEISGSWSGSQGEYTLRNSTGSYSARLIDGVLRVLTQVEGQEHMGHFGEVIVCFE